MSYQAILARQLNIDFVNLGFSGNGKGEPAVAKMVGQIDASAFVLDFAQNNPTIESLREVYEPFLETIRKEHPQTPIVVITAIASSRETERLDQMRRHVRHVRLRWIGELDRHPRRIRSKADPQSTRRQAKVPHWERNLVLQPLRQADQFSLVLSEPGRTMDFKSRILRRNPSEGSGKKERNHAYQDTASLAAESCYELLPCEPAEGILRFQAGEIGELALRRFQTAKPLEWLLPQTTGSARQ